MEAFDDIDNFDDAPNAFLKQLSLEKKKSEAKIFSLPNEVFSIIGSYLDHKESLLKFCLLSTGCYVAM
jgi:hypothetical protein